MKDDDCAIIGLLVWTGGPVLAITTSSKILTYNDSLARGHMSYFIKDDGHQSITQHFSFKIIASICAGHSFFGVLYEMNTANPKFDETEHS